MKKIIDLKNRFVIESGEVILTYDCLLELARDGIAFHSYRMEANPLLDTYNKISENPVEIFDNTKKAIKAQWFTPEPFASLDLTEFCCKCLVAFNLLSEEYSIRLEKEFFEIEKKSLTNLMRHAAYIVDTFRKNKVVWGVGRGSSCASLVLYLIGLHKIDPVRYNIPMKEFYKD